MILRPTFLRAFLFFCHLLVTNDKVLRRSQTPVRPDDPFIYPGVIRPHIHRAQKVDTGDLRNCLAGLQAGHKNIDMVFSLMVFVRLSVFGVSHHVSFMGVSRSVVIPVSPGGFYCTIQPASSCIRFHSDSFL